MSITTLVARPSAVPAAAGTVARPGFSLISYDKLVLASYQARPAFYIIRHGDTLSKIAAKYHLRWEGLYWANRHILGGNPDSITAGERIALRTEAGYKPPVRVVTTSAVTRHTGGAIIHAGIYSFSGLEALWVAADGPSGVKWAAATIAECESGGNPRAYNRSGASGLWQILGVPFPGNPFDPWTNARMAVAKYRGAGYNFSPWVCRA
jgi:hypothetical protein